jgi:hypothetical protein
MAKLYKGSIGRWKNVEQVAALQEDVQEFIDKYAREGAAKAENELAHHRVENHARIEMEEGDVDRYVILSDELGLKAALSIEYGRQELPPSDDLPYGQSASPGLFILHEAMNLPRRGKRITKGGDTFD